MFSYCSAIVNAASTSSSVAHFHIGIPFPSPVTFLLVFPVCMRATLAKFADHHQLLDYLYHILVELSSSAVGFHKLTSWWTLVNGHT